MGTRACASVSLAPASAKLGQAPRVVSRAREFVSSLATRVLEIRLDGKMVNYLGNYEEYLASQGIG